MIQELAKNKLPQIRKQNDLTDEGSVLCKSIKDSALNSDAILILTEWSELKKLIGRIYQIS